MKNKAVNIIMTVLLLFTALHANAAKDRNYIFIFDCTGSMIKTNKCWESAKDYLHKQLDEQLDEGDNFTIVPFQDDPRAVIKGNQSNYKWSQIDKELESIIHSSHSSTGICKAWEASLKYIDKTRNNYVFLLTDGQEEFTPQRLPGDLVKWGTQPATNHAFYVMLTPQATQIRNDVGDKRPDNLHFVDANGKIPDFVAVTPIRPIDSYQFIPSIELPFEVSTKRQYTGIKATTSNQHFKVELVGGKLVDGEGTIRITPNYRDVASLNDAIGSKNDIVISLSGNNVQFVNPLIVPVVNKPERVVSSNDFVAQVPTWGKASHYNKFLFWGANEQGKITHTFSPSFSPEAIRANAIARFRVVDTDGHNDFDVTVNGKSTNVIELRAADNNKPVEITITFNENAKSGKRHLALKAQNCSNLDRIQEARPANAFEFPFTVKYSLNWNPLKTILMWLGIALLGALLLWFLVLKQMLYSYIKVGALRISEPYFSQRRISGARRVVLTSKAQKQGVLNRIFTGRIIYEVNPAWTSTVVLEAASKGNVKMRSNKDYTIDPYASTLNKQNEYELTNVHTNQKFKITVY